MKTLLLPSARKRQAARAATLLAAGFLAPLLVAGCTSRPFVVESPREATAALNIDVEAAEARGPHEYNPDPRPISLCYSSQLNRPDQVLERARDLCPYGGSLRYWNEDTFANGCGLFQPQRVTFICTPGPKPDSPYDD